MEHYITLKIEVQRFQWAFCSVNEKFYIKIREIDEYESFNGQCWTS